MSDAIKEFADNVASKDPQWPKLKAVVDPKDDATRWAWIELLIKQSERSWRCGVNVAIVCNTEIEAEELHKLLKKAKRVRRT